MNLLGLPPSTLRCILSFMLWDDLLPFLMTCKFGLGLALGLDIVIPRSREILVSQRMRETIALSNKPSKIDISCTSEINEHILIHALFIWKDVHELYLRDVYVLPREKTEVREHIGFIGHVHSLTLDGCLYLNPCTKDLVVSFLKSNWLQNLSMGGWRTLEWHDVERIVSACPSIKTLSLTKGTSLVEYIHHNNIVNLDLQYCNQLKRLVATKETKIELLNISGCSSLESDLGIYDFIRKKCPVLKELRASSCIKLTNITISCAVFLELVDLSMCVSLATFVCMKCPLLSRVEVGFCEGLEEIRVGFNASLLCLDLSLLGKLGLIELYHNENLKFVDVRGSQAEIFRLEHCHIALDVVTE